MTTRTRRQTKRCPSCKQVKCECTTNMATTTRFTKAQMLEYLDETIRLEAGSDACFPNQKFPDHTIAKQIRELVANA